MNTWKHIKPLALATAALLPVAAWPATTTTTFAVTTTVISACIVAATPLAFGSYDPTSVTAATGTNVISVTCTSAAPYNVGLDPGATSGATVSTRDMKNGAVLLPYSLYRDSGRTLNWGQTVGTDTLAGTGNGLLQAITVYGRIPAGATVAAGAFTDTVTVTVTY